jgi:SAM-dependent methyltransferase/CelD/BcsL family acetyltransferase involved in cellulose biosynthesis
MTAENVTTLSSTERSRIVTASSDRSAVDEDRSIETVLITDWNALDDLRDDWNRLWKRTDTCREEFYDFDWMCTVARHQVPFPGHPWCVVARKEGAVVGIAPLYWHRTRATRLQMPLRSITFFPNDFICRHNFLSEEEDEILLDGVVQRLSADRRIDIAVFTGLTKENAHGLFGYAKKQGVGCSLLQVNRAKGGLDGTASVDLCAIDLNTTWNEFLRSRKPKLRRNLRRRERKAASLGSVSLWRHSGGRQICGEERSVPEIVDWIRLIEMKSWKLELSIHLGYQSYQYLEHLISIALSVESLDISFLLLDNAPIAYSFALVSGGWLRECRIGYDGDYRQISPGVLLRARVIRTSIEETGIRYINLGGSKHVDKHELVNLKDSGYEVTIYSNRWRSRLLQGFRQSQGRYHIFADRELVSQGTLEGRTSPPRNPREENDKKGGANELLMNDLKNDQRRDVTEKYTQDGEWSFWSSFAFEGLLKYESRAVDLWIPVSAHILDIGCGCGREALVLARMGHHVFAMDLVPRMVETTMQRFHQEGLSIRLVQGDVCDGIPFRGRFDAAVLFEQVYQHIPTREDRLQALRNVSRCLHPDGVILLSSFNEGDIDLVARLVWLRESNFDLAKSIVLDRSNPLESRYLNKGDDLRCKHPPSCFREWLAVGRWVMAYSWNLFKRKVRTRLSRVISSGSNSHQCKRITKTNPLTHSEGSFLLQVLSFRELRSELEEAGLEICDVLPLLETGHGFSERAKRGAPLYTIVARRCLALEREEDDGPSPA